MSTPAKTDYLTRQELGILTHAEKLLATLEDRLRDDSASYNSGYVAHAASNAQHAIFDLKNCLDSYGLQHLADDVLHWRKSR